MDAEVEAVVRKLDTYAGPAAEVRPAVGSVAVPLRLLAELREALRAAREVSPNPRRTLHPTPGSSRGTR